MISAHFPATLASTVTVEGYSPIYFADKLTEVPPPAIIFQSTRLGHTNDTSKWYRFDLENKDALTKRWLIKFRAVPYKKLDLFIPANKGYELKQFGVFSKQNLTSNNTALISLPNKISNPYFIRIDSPYPYQLTPELWPESVYILEQYKTFTIATCLQAIMALLLIITLVKALTNKSKAQFLLASHIFSINILLLLNQGGLFQLTPAIADPGHWVMTIATIAIITAMACYQQTAQLSLYTSLATNRFMLAGCITATAVVTSTLLLPAQSEWLIPFGLTTASVTIFSALGNLIYCTYKGIRPAKNSLTGMSIILAPLSLSFFIEPWPRSTLTLLESSLLTLQAMILTFIYWYNSKPELQKAASMGIISHSSHKRRIFESALRQHLQKPDMPLKIADIPERVLSTLEAVLPETPASVITYKRKKWSVTGSDNKVITAFKKQLPALQQDIKAVINTNEDSRINLKDGKGSTYWLFPLDVESSSQTVLMLAPVKPQDTNTCWNTACDIASHSRTLYQASKQSRYWEIQASLDPLTGLLNRLAFAQEAEKHLLNDNNNEWPHCCLLFLDLDNFKQINDQQGHPKGDEILINIAKICTRCLRQEDLICRYGGEEFAVLLPGTEPWQAWQVAERIRQSIERSPGTIGITASIGLAAFGQNTPTLTRLLQEADAALYEAKRRGKNRIVRAESCKDLRLPS